MNYSEIGQRIRKYRKANNLSQEQLAEKIGISITHMSHIETANTKLSLPVLVNIAEELNVRTDDLLFESQQTKSILLEEFSNLFDDCSPELTQIIIDVSRTVKTSILKNMKNQVDISRP